MAGESNWRIAAPTNEAQKLLDALAAMQRDVERLDWLEQQRQVSIDKGFQWNAWNYDAEQSKLTIRQQIDAARDSAGADGVKDQAK